VSEERSEIMADWDADDFEPGEAGAPKVSDKWEGEDEDDDIKDAWDAESEEENSQKDESEVKAVKVKKKKTLAQKIAEKEEAAALAREERIAREEEEKQLNTPEGKLAEKMRLQKLAEENDLKLAQEMMGLSGGGAGGVIDNANPSTKEQFEDLSKAITDKLSNFESSEHYQDFIEHLVKNLCPTLTAQTLKKCKTHAEAFHSAKLKEEKAAAAKSKKGKGAGPKLKLGSATGCYDGYDDMDDFM